MTEIVHCEVIGIPAFRQRDRDIVILEGGGAAKSETQEFLQHVDRPEENPFVVQDIGLGFCSYGTSVEAEGAGVLRCYAYKVPAERWLGGVDGVDSLWYLAARLNLCEGWGNIPLRKDQGPCRGSLSCIMVVPLGLSQC